jgi:Glycosyl hydrolases family 2
MAQLFEITVGDVTDVEARVYARYARATGEGIELRGVIRGPFCERARTLTAEFVFRPLRSEVAADVLAEAVVTDPCMWSAEMPHVYDVEVEACAGEQVVASHHEQIGLRRLAPRRPVDFAPGTG